MAQLKIIRAEDAQPQDMREKEAGQVKRILATEKFFFNIDEVHPATARITGTATSNTRPKPMKSTTPRISRRSISSSAAKV